MTMTKFEQIRHLHGCGETVRDALDASIERWQENLERAKDGSLTSMYMTASDCALCTEFYEEEDPALDWFDDEGCYGCPLNAVGKRCGVDSGDPWRDASCVREPKEVGAMLQTLIDLREWLKTDLEWFEETKP